MFKISNYSYMNNKILLLIVVIGIIIYFICTNENPIKEGFSNLINKNFGSKKKYTMAIMAIFKNEQDYMEEWIEYHLKQGFDHLFLYCNDPEFQKYPFLKNNKYSKYVTVIDWVNKVNQGNNTIQRQAYQHCTKTYGPMCQFLMMLDFDEFVHPTKNFKTVKEYIMSLSNQWDKIASFKIQRFDFGSNGHMTKPNMPVTQAYTKHEKICSTYKTLANTDFVNLSANFYGVHDFPYNNKKGKFFNEYLNYKEKGYPIGCKKEHINEIPLVINHYYTKSFEEYLNRCKLWKNGGINPVGYRKNCEIEFKKRDVNDVIDFD